MMSCDENVFCMDFCNLEVNISVMIYVHVVYFILTVISEKLHSALRIFLLYMCICALIFVKLDF